MYVCVCVRVYVCVCGWVGAAGRVRPVYGPMPTRAQYGCWSAAQIQRAPECGQHAACLQTARAQHVCTASSVNAAADCKRGPSDPLTTTTSSPVSCASFGERGCPGRRRSHHRPRRGL
jgi:hypothetical protein